MSTIEPILILVSMESGWRKALLTLAGGCRAPARRCCIAINVMLIISNAHFKFRTPENIEAADMHAGHYTCVTIAGAIELP
jgi:hypothetical protein